jgi:allophanate hydrolase subunit 2
MLSEPALRGAIEIPQDGQPIVFLADHPTICGYPIVAVLDALSADLAAQLRPGQLVRIRPYRLT